MDDKWRTVRCPSCSGSGLYWNYTYDEPAECRYCDGSGRVFIRPTGHTFSYPGGPATGMWSKEVYDKEGIPYKEY